MDALAEMELQANLAADAYEQFEVIDPAPTKNLANYIQMQAEEGIDADLAETEAILRKNRKSKDEKKDKKAAPEANVAQKVKSSKEDASKPENHHKSADK